MLTVGSRIGEFVILKRLGKGLEGEVYKVRWRTKRGEIIVALKILKHHDFRSILKQVSRWARVSQHQNILEFYDANFFLEDGDFYTVSEFAGEGDLEQWIVETKGSLREHYTQAVDIMIGVLKGLHHLHQNDIIHCDIKPSNIFLINNVPVLADFGLARGLAFEQSNDIGGTHYFWSPEIAVALINLQNKKIISYEHTEADDLWATAATFQRLLTGNWAFDDLLKIKECQPNSLPASIPPVMHGFFQRAFHPNISERFPDVLEMDRALYQIKKELSDQKGTDREKELEQKLEEQRLAAEAREDALQKQIAELQKEDLRALEEKLKRKSIADTAKNKSKLKKAAVIFIPSIIIASIFVYCNISPSGTNQNSTNTKTNSPVANAMPINANAMAMNANSATSYEIAGDECEIQDYNCKITEYNAAVKANPDLASAYKKLGEAYAERAYYGKSEDMVSDNKNAVAYLSRYTELNPTDPYGYGVLGAAHNNIGNYREAIDTYTKAISRKDDAEFYLMRAQTFNSLKETANVKKDCEKYWQYNIENISNANSNPRDNSLCSPYRPTSSNSNSIDSNASSANSASNIMGSNMANTMSNSANLMNSNTRLGNSNISSINSNKKSSNTIWKCSKYFMEKCKNLKFREENFIACLGC